MRRRAIWLLILASSITCGRGHGPAGRFPSHARDAGCLDHYVADAPLETSARYSQCAHAHLYAVGAGDPLSDDALLAYQQAHAASWIDHPGMLSVGLGGCCENAAAPNTCIVVDLAACTTPPSQIIDAIAAGAPGAFRISLRLAGGQRRCLPHDPDCQPVGYSGAKYWPDRGREPVHDHLPQLGGLSGGACEHDGDCVTAGCGNHCVAWTEPSFAGTCEAYTALEPALCGCVDHLCTWFTQ